MQHHSHSPSAPPEPVRTSTGVATGDEGFTLIELVLVVLILGLLTSVVVIAVGGIRADAAESGCAADHRTLAVAAEAHRAQYRGIPIPATGTDHDRFERTLVDAGLLRAVSVIHDLDAGGSIHPEGNSPC